MKLQSIPALEQLLLHNDYYGPSVAQYNLSLKMFMKAKFLSCQPYTSPTHLPQPKKKPTRAPNNCTSQKTLGFRRIFGSLFHCKQHGPVKSEVDITPGMSLILKGVNPLPQNLPQMHLTENSVSLVSTYECERLSAMQSLPECGWHGKICAHFGKNTHSCLVKNNVFSHVRI